MKPFKRISYNFLLETLTLLLLFSISLIAQSQNLKQFVGEWKSGDVTLDSYKPSLLASDHNSYLRINFVISKNDSSLSARMESPDANVLWMDADQTEVSGDSIKLYFNGIKGIFTGILNSEKNQMIGSLDFLGKRIPLGLKKEE